MSGKRTQIDRLRYPHDYVGSDTNWGLRSGEPCRIVGRGPAGGKRIQTPDGKRWLVGAKEVRRAGL